MIISGHVADIFCSLPHPITPSSCAKYGIASLFSDTITLTGLMSEGSSLCRVSLTARVGEARFSVHKRLWQGYLYDIDTMKALDLWVYQNLWVGEGGEWGLRKKIIDAIGEEVSGEDSGY